MICSQSQPLVLGALALRPLREPTSLRPAYTSLLFGITLCTYELYHKCYSIRKRYLLGRGNLPGAGGCESSHPALNPLPYLALAFQPLPGAWLVQPLPFYLFLASSIHCDAMDRLSMSVTSNCNLWFLCIRSYM